jgi:pSer/pThr/pTyr-binding forkhead associated (FHA) protein
MSFFYVLEILSASGDVHSRHKYTDLPVRIGRGYHNDIVLDDPHTAAEHAQLELDEQGQLRLRDLDSRNGIKLQGRRERQFHPGSEDIFHLGQTQLRIRDSNYQVAPEVADETNHRWQGWPLFSSGLLVISLLALLDMWVGDISNSKPSAYVMTIATWLGFAAVWSGIWALANRAFAGGAHFGRHIFTLACGLGALTLMDYICLFLAFGFSWEWATRYSSHLQIAIVATTIYYHLRHISSRQRHRLKTICISLWLIGASLTLIKNYQATNSYADELYMSEQLPPALRVSRDHSLREFDQSIGELQKTIDEERDHSLKEKAKNRSEKAADKTEEKPETDEGNKNDEDANEDAPDSLSGTEAGNPAGPEAGGGNKG